MNHGDRMGPVQSAEEGFADPQQIVLVLVLETAVGMHPGMDEEVVADAMLQRQRFQQSAKISASWRLLTAMESSYRRRTVDP